MLFPLLFAEKEFPETSLQFRQKLQKPFALSWDTIKLLKQHLGKQSKLDLGRFFLQKVHVVLYLSFVAAWLDLLIWSRMRNSLITERSLLRFPTFRMCIFRQFQSIRQVLFFCRFWPSEYFFLHFQIRCRTKIALLQEMTKTSDFSRRSEAGNK